jgi:hypothetical protein
MCAAWPMPRARPAANDQSSLYAELLRVVADEMRGIGLLGVVLAVVYKRTGIKPAPT